MTAPTKLYVCVDIIVYHIPSNRILMIRRKNDPYRSKLAFPGGYIDPGETAEEAAVRETSEEVNLRFEVSDLTFFNQYSDPERDPRGRVISLVFYVMVDSTRGVTPGDDADMAWWYDPEALIASEGEVAFDHQMIVKDFVDRLMLR